jgi:hypothetical protein
MISAVMAVQLLALSLCKPWLWGMADSWEESSVALGGNNAGRLRMMSLGLLTSTVATVSHCLGSMFIPAHWSKQTDESQPLHPPMMAFTYHLILGIFFILGTGACSLALDGPTLAQLEQQGTDKNHYREERMYGALSWGISHVAVDPVIDYFGFGAIYSIQTTPGGACLSLSRILWDFYSKMDQFSIFHSLLCCLHYPLGCLLWKISFYTSNSSAAQQ